MRHVFTHILGAAAIFVPTLAFGVISFYWNGPGSRLQLYTADDTLTSVDHPSADGTYTSLHAAKAAALRFATSLDNCPGCGGKTYKPGFYCARCAS